MYRRLNLAVIPLFALLSVAYAKSATTPGTQTTTSLPMEQMPIVAPLFIEDGDFTGTLILVNGSAVTTYADVSLRAMNGETVATRRVQFAPYSQRQVSIRDLLNSGTSPNLMSGSITVMQSPELSGMAITAALSMTRQSSPVPN